MKKLSIVSMPFILSLIPLSYLGWWGLGHDNQEWVRSSFWGILIVLAVWTGIIFMGIVDRWLDDYA